LSGVMCRIKCRSCWKEDQFNDRNSDSRKKGCLESGRMAKNLYTSYFLWFTHLYLYDYPHVKSGFNMKARDFLERILYHSCTLGHIYLGKSRKRSARKGKRTCTVRLVLLAKRRARMHQLKYLGHNLENPRKASRLTYKVLWKASWNFG